MWPIQDTSAELTEQFASQTAQQAAEKDKGPQQAVHQVVVLLSVPETGVALPRILCWIVHGVSTCVHMYIYIYMCITHLHMSHVYPVLATLASFAASVEALVS